MRASFRKITAPIAVVAGVVLLALGFHEHPGTILKVIGIVCLIAGAASVFVARRNRGPVSYDDDGNPIGTGKRNTGR